MSIVIGLIAFFRGHRAVMTSEYLSRVGRFISRITFRYKWLNHRTKDPSKNWANEFFFMKNN
ncbi:hypothetical protein IEQ34_017117 [Dendrobium chrysotoxum]|uniref:Uncharacterized protein n=1 Tax=Dendrobium chrysotoxum TaxID=161865 RepID=A0AAV7GBP4_DENCH|nr:hypothetical protein IEQ34_017117 [Dendrobium chrysotoxum]